MKYFILAPIQEHMPVSDFKASRNMMFRQSGLAVRQSQIGEGLWKRGMRYALDLVRSVPRFEVDDRTEGGY